jgi:cytochrome b
MSDATPSLEAQIPEEGDPSRRLLWDWPTRLFHWTLAGLFTAAFAVATLSSEHGWIFPIHATLGLTLAVAVLMRVIWGLVGSRPSRFTSFLFSPAALLRYFREALAARDRPAAGHNPGSSYAVYAMLLIPLGLAATGIAQGQGLKWAEELHEGLAFAMVAVVVLHILGLAWHTLRHRENIAMSMFHGERMIPAESALSSSRPWAGAAFLALLGAWAASLANGLDARGKRITLPVLGTTLQIGENETAEPEHQARGHERRDDD